MLYFYHGRNYQKPEIEMTEISSGVICRAVGLAEIVFQLYFT